MARPGRGSIISVRKRDPVCATPTIKEGVGSVGTVGSPFPGSSKGRLFGAVSAFRAQDLGNPTSHEQ